MQEVLAGTLNRRSRITRARLLRATRPELGLGLDAFLPLLLADLAVLEVAAFDGALRRLVPLREPVAEGVAEPGRLRPQLRQAELFPDLLRALHVFLFRQRKRRHVSFHGRVHVERGILFVSVLALGAMALAAVRQRLHVLERVHAVRHGPQERVGVVRVDVVRHRDGDLAHVALEEGRAAQRAPYLGARHAFFAADYRHAQQSCQWFVKGHSFDSADAERLAQVGEEQRLVGDALDDARLRRRDLADIRGDDRVPALRDRGHAHGHVVFLERHVAVRFAERRLGLAVLGVDQAFYYDLRFRGNEQIDGLRPDHVDRTAGQTAGYVELVHADRQLLRPHEGDIRRAPEHDGAGHRLFSEFLVFHVVQVAARAPYARRHAHDQPVGRLERGAIGAHVLHAGLGIAGDHVGRGERGRGVETRRRDRDRQAVEAAAFALQRFALVHDLMAGGALELAWCDGMSDRVIPFPLDFAQGRAHADRVDRAVRRDRPDHDRNVVLAAAAVDDVREEERLPLGFVHPPDELPAHQRMELRVLVDRPGYREQQPAFLQFLEVLVKVTVAARALRRERRFGAGQVHCFSIFARSTTAFHLAVSETISSRR